MPNAIDWKRIGLFVLFAFAIAWAGALVIYLTGGLVNSPPLLGGRITLAVLLLATVYMGAPALAHILTRLITREGWKNLYFAPKLRRGWPYWLLAWFAPGLLVFVGMAVFFLFLPRYYDPTLSTLQLMLATTGRGIAPWTFILGETAVALALAPLLNALPTLGEEFGWRGYLLPKLMPLGGRRAIVLVGMIWGIWHWPVIWMGYEYGLDYPGFPWTGMLLFVWFTITASALLGWMALRAGSVWPAVIAHGALNGIAAIALLFSQGQPSPLLGPAANGLIGSFGFVLVALVLLLAPGALQARREALPAGLAAEPAPGVSIPPPAPPTPPA